MGDVLKNPELKAQVVTDLTKIANDRWLITK
jgi:hypothetical protein